MLALSVFWNVSSTSQGYFWGLCMVSQHLALRGDNKQGAAWKPLNSCEARAGSCEAQVASHERLFRPDLIPSFLELGSQPGS